ncbi:MAG: YciI family protein [Arenicellales bacterium]
MQYLLLIYSAEDAGPQPGEAEYGEFMNDYYAFTKEVRERGIFEGGQPLDRISTATTVSVRDGETQVSDGPFAETKEVLGGYYLLDCKNLDEALECAAKIPTAKYGSIEVRPIMQIPGADQA